MMEKPSIIVICGPTAVGKTAVAIELAKRFHGEIISADSMQIYRYMDIGTAKPDASELSQARHHLIDILNPDEPFDAAAYAAMAGDIIRKLHSQGIVSIVAGGTGLYIRALLHGIFEEKSSDPEIRQRLKEELREQGAEAMYQRLRQCDPNTSIHPNDTFRMIRALEVFEISGKPISEYHRQHGFRDDPFDALIIVLFTEREILYDRINRRVDRMIEQGFAEEVRKLLDMGYSPQLKSMQSIGYRHICDYMAKSVSWEECVRLLKRDTRRYAKRQMTWFRAEPDAIWVRAENWQDSIERIQQVIRSDPEPAPRDSAMRNISGIAVSGSI
jgi:tRNA dimethylallyltransferase